MSAPTSGYQTNHVSTDNLSDVNKQNFVVRSLLSGVRTSLPVQVMAVTNDGGVSPIGYVDIQPLVGQIDGSGNVTPHGVIRNVPYMRIQGGANAIILDPEVDDIGVAVFCDRDISTVKGSGGAAGPGSRRKHNLSDAIYLYTVIGGPPAQYVLFNAEGISVVSPTAVNVTAPTATVTTTGAVSVTAGTEASVTAPSISLGATGQTLLQLVTSAMVTFFNGHTHTSEAPGTPTSAPIQTMGSGQLTSTIKGG
jgi:hypothetical protein